jgi:hypothetical protein
VFVGDLGSIQFIVPYFPREQVADCRLGRRSGNKYGAMRVGAPNGGLVGRCAPVRDASAERRRRREAHLRDYGDRGSRSSQTTQCSMWRYMSGCTVA